MGDNDQRFSVELCGGTHVRRTGDIGSLKVIAETAVSSGVRRIEAVAGGAFIQWAEDRDEMLAEAAEVLKCAPTDLTKRIVQLIEDRKRLERDLSDTRKQMATGGAGSAPSTAQINGITYAGRVLEGVPAKDLKGMADEIKKQIGSGVVALVSSDEGKASIVVAVTDDLTASISAVDLVRVGSEALGGKGGGGRPDMAQAGGPNADAAQDAVDAVAAKLRA